MAPVQARGSLSSQSSLLETYPGGWLQASVWKENPPVPSPSESAYQVVASAESGPSVLPSQLLSTPSQTSVAPGFTAVAVSSQSVSSATCPVGALQASTDVLVSP